MRSADAEPSSTVFGRYHLGPLVAKGGMASVYLARIQGSAGFEKSVALKLILPSLSEDQDFVAMFMDEARIASKIDHPNVCTVFDFGRVDGRYYLAMEYLRGQSLRHVLRRVYEFGPEPDWVRTLCTLMVQTCEGLHAAHELRDPDGLLLDVVHRDISPHNIFVTYDGVAKIVDFGIASARNREHHTTTGTIKGKLAYMAPEQLTGAELDRRVDVWALGIVLWEALTGRRLFRGRTDSETLFQVMTKEVPAPSSLTKNVPKELDAIVAKALQRDPSRRYADARAFGRALSEFLSTSGPPLLSSDVAQWMGELFAQEKHAQRETDAWRIEEPTVVQGESVRPTTTATPADGQARLRTLAPLALLAVLLITVIAIYLQNAGESARHPSGLTAQSSTTAPQLATRGVAPVPVTIAAAEGSGEPGGSDTGSNEHSSTDAERATPRAPEDPVTLSPRPSSFASTPSMSVSTAPAPMRASTNRSPMTPSTMSASMGAPSMGSAMSSADDEPGTLTISASGGWAQLLLDGSPIGDTPLRRTLSAGTHVLEVRPFGRTPGSTIRMRIPPGGDVRRVLQLSE